MTGEKLGSGASRDIGLVLFDTGRVISPLDVKLRMPCPLKTALTSSPPGQSEIMRSAKTVVRRLAIKCQLALQPGWIFKKGQSTVDLTYRTEKSIARQRPYIRNNQHPPPPAY
jgi:hypothetical protein